MLRWRCRHGRPSGVVERRPGHEVDAGLGQRAELVDLLRQGGVDAVVDARAVVLAGDDEADEQGQRDQGQAWTSNSRALAESRGRQDRAADSANGELEVVVDRVAVVIDDPGVGGRVRPAVTVIGVQEGDQAHRSPAGVVRSIVTGRVVPALTGALPSTARLRGR